MRPLLPRLGGNWGYLAAAVGCAITFVLMFEPWLSTSGPDGTVWSNAFGQTHISTTLVGLWSQHPPNHSNLKGKWAVLAAIAIFLTVPTAVINVWTRITSMTYLTTGAAVAVALFIISTLIYLSGAGPELRNMVGSGPPTELGVQAGFIIRWATGRGDYPWPGGQKAVFETAKLTGTAMTAGAMAVLSASAAIAQTLYQQKMRRRSVETEAQAPIEIEGTQG
ncbi:hypothetical protein BJY24_007635 [Nocardia transvalensis]|uniref:Uncharacterized protein n=1 Tax=Nocardia transvalensis TaxID=37333 RepID=A0A7W9UMK6_9NOCA|nr:hypothetical protein [Nocardia transvalensis]MBB5918723.1 hypothetical protein [Nocardia transvalensis]